MESEEPLFPPWMDGSPAFVTRFYSPVMDTCNLQYNSAARDWTAEEGYLSIASVSRL